MSVAVVFIITFTIAGINTGKQKNVDVAHNNVLIRDIVDVFDCSCGSCNKKLIDCDCPTAQDTNKFIENTVADGRYSRKEIIEKVAERYGHLIDKSKSKG